MCFPVLAHVRVTTFFCARMKRWLMDDYRGLWLGYCCFNIDSRLHSRPFSCLTLFFFFSSSSSVVLRSSLVHLNPSFINCGLVQGWRRSLCLCACGLVRDPESWCSCVFVMLFALPGIDHVCLRNGYPWIPWSTWFGACGWVRQPNKIYPVNKIATAMRK